MNKMNVTFNDVAEQVRDIANQITISKLEIDYIVGLARGGLAPAVMLSHLLNKPMICAEYSTRDNMTMNNGIKWLAHIDNALVVDDIADTGKTLEYIKSINEDIKIATLVYKSHTSKVKPDYYAQSINLDDWVVFPWELEK